MGAIEIGIRELQRGTSEVMERVQEEGLHAIVSKSGRPVAVIVPLPHAHAWVLQNRPLGDGFAEDDAGWPVREGVRVAPGAEAGLAALKEPVRRRLLTQLRRLRNLDATGRITVRAGLLFALADLSVDDVPTLLDVARGAELRRWFYAAGRLSQPM